jgi:hypothetical protein
MGLEKFLEGRMKGHIKRITEKQVAKLKAARNLPREPGLGLPRRIREAERRILTVITYCWLHCRALVMVSSSIRLTA